MNEEIYIDVSYKVLIWARESLALNHSEVSEKTGIVIERLIQLESGEKIPTLGELKAFSKAYKRTIATLLLKEPPKEKPLPPDRRSVNSIEIGFFHQKTIIAIRKARALAQTFVELRNELGKPFPKFNLSATLYDNPQLVAEEIRQLLGLNKVKEITNIRMALESYIEKVEGLGVGIFQLGLTKDNVRGFAIVDDLIPIIGIKRGSETPHSKIFTLFHELGHIILNEGSISDLSLNPVWKLEKWCNAFAAEVLIPTSELLQMEIVKTYKNQNRKIWLKKDLIDLGNYFHVGLLAILRKLLDNGLTTNEFYRSKHDLWNKPTFHIPKSPEPRNYPKEAIQEKGKTYIGLAFNAYDQNRINLKDLADYLGVKLSNIPKTRQLLHA